MSSPTAALSFQLITLEGVIEALGFFGITWTPEVVDHEAGGDMLLTSGLYAWTTSGSVVLRTGVDTFDEDEKRRKARSMMIMDFPIVRSDIRVLPASLRQVQDRGFPLALHTGEVLMDENPDLQWLLDAGLSQRSLDGVLSRMLGPFWEGSSWFAHQLIFRLGAYIGDMAVPLDRLYHEVDQFPRMEPDSIDEAAKRAAARLLGQST